MIDIYISCFSPTVFQPVTLAHSNCYSFGLTSSTFVFVTRSKEWFMIKLAGHFTSKDQVKILNAGKLWNTLPQNVTSAPSLWETLKDPSHQSFLSPICFTHAVIFPSF